MLRIPTTPGKYGNHLGGGGQGLLVEWLFCIVFIIYFICRTREDYICTDDDLDLLSKFPRHNLKLEK